MPANHLDESRPEPAVILFHCAACGLRLSVAKEMAAVSGPCPGCGTVISAPPEPTATRPFSLPQGCPIPVKMAPKARIHKGRIRGDTSLDHAHLENRESRQTLVVLGMFFLTLCACSAVIWLLSR